MASANQARAQHAAPLQNPSDLLGEKRLHAKPAKTIFAAILLLTTTAGMSYC
jgi:hypothetical protein